MKKITGMILSAVLLLNVTVSAAGFNDTKGHWAEQTINTLAERNVIDGIAPGVFAPDKEVTRAQYLKMIMEATGMSALPYRKGECLELNGSEWYAGYLQSALDKGLVPSSMITGFKQKVEYKVDENGTATESKVVYSGAFNGDLVITREEMAVLTQYIYQYTRTILTNKPTDIEQADSFSDDDNISSWAYTSVKLAAANGFIEGMDDGSFKPQNGATRAQAATIILRVSEK